MKTRKVDYELYIKKMRPIFSKKRAAIENSFIGRSPRMRPRDPQEEKLLTRLDKLRWQSALSRGEITQLAERIFRIHL